MASPSAVEPFPNYRGLHTSLYKPLPTETVQHIERAIWLKQIGQTDAARAIFSNELEPAKKVPIVIMEHADLEIEAGRWGKAWRILDSALNDLKNADADLDLPEHRLMMLTRVMLGVRHRGDIDSAAQEIERTSRWLCDVPVKEYTDVQTNCVRRYVVVYLFMKLHSNYQNPAAEHIPRNDPDGTSAEPWSGLHSLRRSLVARGMFNEANILFRVESNRTPLKDRDPIFEEFLDAIATLPTSRGRHFIESAVRLQWSTSYVQLHNLQRAKEELANSETALNMWCTEFNASISYAIPSFQALICEKLNLVGDHALKLDVAEQLIALFEQTGSSKTGWCLSTAAESAFSLFESTGKDEYLAKYFTLNERLLQFDETESEDLCDLVIHRNSLITVTQKNMVDRQKSVEWIDGFFKRYPYFASPGELASLHSRKALLLKGLGRYDEAKEAEDATQKYNTMGPSLGKWMHMSLSNAIVPGASTASTSEYDSEDGDGLPFSSCWLTVVRNVDKTPDTVVGLLFDWSFDDLLKDRLTVEEFQRITNVSEDLLRDPRGIDEATVERIKSHERGNMLSFLFPPDASSETSQKVRWETVINWLSNPPKGQRNKRLYCLLMLRKHRDRHFSGKRLWDLRILELQHLLELNERLPSLIREICPTDKASWFCDLALTYLAQIGGTPDLQDWKTYELLLEAENSCGLGVKEFRRHYQPNQLALLQRVGAQICILKIRRLEQQLKQMSAGAEQSLQQDQTAESTAHHKFTGAIALANEITTLRKVGLENLKETDQINTASELEASWLDGLDGVEHRRRVSEFHCSFYTIYNAMTLLLVEQEPSGETINEAWNWVQKYKARSLSRTIGMRSTVPPSLLKLILASADARPIYEEMLDLQKQINDAEASARFTLRQRLDAHRRQMRTYPLLRRLIDLREGTPLDLSDIAAIEAGAGRPIVLVDWFYLPPYPDDAEGRLLLFTARRGYAATMDVLTTKIEDVNAWQDQYLNPERLRDEETRIEFDAMLGGLVAPLLHRTEENEILVFCPSTILHRLPLHALSVTTPLHTQALIRRNPIVYIHSHSLLRSCFSATEHARHSPDSINARFLSGISEADATHYGAGRAGIKDLAQRFDTPPMIDESASKEDFMSAVKESRMLHLHTHCGWNFADPLDHHVEFPRLDGTDGPTSLPDHKLTAKEIFDMTFLPGTHVNMIACQGGVTEVKLGDEVMGLVPALLHSGASSVVSTLWSITDRHGAEFSRFFFESFLQQCVGRQDADPLASLNNMRQALSGETKTDSACFVDIAVALREAAMEMDPYGLEPLYGWAGFVLHGFWQFSLSIGEAQWLQRRQREA